MPPKKRTGILAMTANVKAKVGDRFGGLTVIGHPFYAVVHSKRTASICYVCRCDCGKVTVRAQYQFFNSGRPVRSCGCLVGKCSNRHGMSGSRLHNIWCGMKSRAKGTSGQLGRAYYSERGISVCDEWQVSFESFRDWAISKGYQDDLEIDRIDNDRGYEPANCRWATRFQQMRNTRKRCNAKTSRFRGVSRHSQNGTWIAQFGLNGKTKYIGSFDSEADAARAYDAVAKKLFGEFASLNFTEEQKCSV